MPTPADITKPDSLGRLFDARKFRPFLDSLKRFIPARVGRRPGKSKPKKNPMTTPAEETPAATQPAPEAQPSPAPAPETALPDPPSAPPPDLSDIAAAAAGQPADGEAQPASVELVGTSTAETIIGIIQTALVMIGDDEGILSDTEKTVLRAPLERVLKKYDVGKDALPAEVDLAVALATIIIVRLKKPKTATFAAKVRAWITAKVFNAKGTALAHRVEDATR